MYMITPPTNKVKLARLDRFAPFCESGEREPRKVCIYDNGGVDAGGSIDRYTAVFTGTRSVCNYLAMSEEPFHPQGFGQHGESESRIDVPVSRHLGKKIKFSQLPVDCRSFVLSDYAVMWRLVPAGD